LLKYRDLGKNGQRTHAGSAVFSTGGGGRWLNYHNTWVFFIVSCDFYRFAVIIFAV